jgi:Uma2 family endonuclease
MSMPRAIDYYSADMVRLLPDDGNRYETVHGELLVSPAPRIAHQQVVQRLSLILGKYLEAVGVEGLFSVAADISWAPDTLVQPDLFVADAAEMQAAESWSDVRTLHLVVEVVSPASLNADRFTKRRLYQEQGIAIYWIVDIDKSQVEIWTPDAFFPVVEREQLTWRHPAASTSCAIELRQLFR